MPYAEVNTQASSNLRTCIDHLPDTKFNLWDTYSNSNIQ